MPKILHLVVSLVFVLCGVRIFSEEPTADHTPRLTVATSSGQTVFHIGERIPLVLSFTGPEDNSFAIDLAGYDRSGRMSEDTFNVEPQSGWVDPLAAYFRYGSYMGGGLRGGQYLSSKPVMLKANLNEWVRFDQPGTYTITVTSHRVGPADKDKRRSWAFPRGVIDLVSSNSVKLTIVPATAAWQDATLNRIVHDHPNGPRSGAAPGGLPAAQQNAISDLRFLATTGAVRVLAAQLRDDSASEWDAYFGLIGLPHDEREQGLLSMRSLLSQPGFPVSTMFLEALSWLHMSEADESLPPERIDMRAAELYRQKKLEARDREWQNIVLDLHERKGTALQVTEATLLETQPLHPDPNVATILGTITRESFAQMSSADQTRALQEDWDLIRSRELLPQLREIAQAPPVAPDATDYFFSPRVRIAIALRRWYELEPESATAEAIRQIGQAYPQLYAKEVNYLPNEAFPQFEPLWAETLAQGDDITAYEPAASLLLRFGTGAVSAQMTEILLHPKDSLGNRLDPALAYLVKFDPAAAEAVLQRDPNLLVGQLDSIAKETSPSAILTMAALRQLRNSDPTATADALTYLSHYGDEHVREPIYSAFLLWYERNRYLSSKNLSDLPRDLQPQIDLGHAFVGALLRNQGWLPDAKLKSDVLQHAIGLGMQQSADEVSESSLQVVVIEGDYASYRIGPFDSPNLKLFEEKLDQFPQGTNFTLEHVTCPEQHSQDLLEASLPELFLKHGMKLVMPNSSVPSDR